MAAYSVNSSKNSHQPIVVAVTGPSGAGRNTALNAFEDCGFHRIDNLPPHLLKRVFSQPNKEQKLVLGFGALGVDDYDALATALAELVAQNALEILFVDARDEVIIRRYSETRRRHPHAGDDVLRAGIAQERKLLDPLKSIAAAQIETSAMNPHQLKAEIIHRYADDDTHQFNIGVQSFSYKRGLPAEADMVFDCRFLRNPHWEDALRPMDGRDARVAKYVADDQNYENFTNDIKKQLEYILPAVQREGRSYFNIAFGCSGGRHRSVAIAEMLDDHFANLGWHTNLLHRELDQEHNEQ